MHPFIEFAYDTLSLQNEDCGKKDNTDGNADNWRIDDINQIKQNKYDRDNSKQGINKYIGDVISGAKLHDDCDRIHDNHRNQAKDRNDISDWPANPSDFPIPENGEKGNDRHLPHDFFRDVEPFLDKEDQIKPNAYKSEG